VRAVRNHRFASTTTSIYIRYFQMAIFKNGRIVHFRRRFDGRWSDPNFRLAPLQFYWNSQHRFPPVRPLATIAHSEPERRGSRQPDIPIKKNCVCQSPVRCSLARKGARRTDGLVRRQPFHCRWLGTLTARQIRSKRTGFVCPPSICPPFRYNIISTSQ
jgi:hypothetical protein